MIIETKLSWSNSGCYGPCYVLCYSHCSAACICPCTNIPWPRGTKLSDSISSYAFLFDAACTTAQVGGAYVKDKNNNLKMEDRVIFEVKRRL